MTLSPSGVRQNRHSRSSELFIIPRLVRRFSLRSWTLSPGDLPCTQAVGAKAKSHPRSIQSVTVGEDEGTGTAVQVAAPPGSLGDPIQPGQGAARRKANITM